jgi:hypothetical protein
MAGVRRHDPALDPTRVEGFPQLISNSQQLFHNSGLLTAALADGRYGGETT